MTPTWVQLTYLACAVCFILALKGLSGPKTARTGNLIGATGAVVAVAVPFLYLDLHHVPLMLLAIAIGTATATTAPAAPMRLPVRAVFGPDRPLSARMKQTAQAR